MHYLWWEGGVWAPEVLPDLWGHPHTLHRCYQGNKPLAPQEPWEERRQQRACMHYSGWHIINQVDSSATIHNRIHCREIFKKNDQKKYPKNGVNPALVQHRKHVCGFTCCFFFSFSFLTVFLGGCCQCRCASSWPWPHVGSAGRSNPC